MEKPSPQNQLKIILHGNSNCLFRHHDEHCDNADNTYTVPTILNVKISAD